jgi:HNH endonuclease
LTGGKRRPGGWQERNNVGSKLGRLRTSPTRIGAMESSASKRGASKPGQIHLRIVEVMKKFPEGISGGQIRQELERDGLKPEDQTHLDRRKRDLKKWFVIKKRRSTAIIDGKKRNVVLYEYAGERKDITDEGQIGIKLRAEVIHSAHGRCQMCGRTVEQHGIVLVVDHKKPRNWGGTNDRSNLWAICEECNAGKKEFFSSLRADAEVMKRALGHKSVHVRIGELLKAVGVGIRTPSPLIDVVADQDDWQKRLRELRYPVIGWEIDTQLYKDRLGRKQCDYVLRKHKPWPEDPSGKIRRFEQERERRNRVKGYGY